MFFTIHTNFRYIILFSTIANLVFIVKLQSFFIKPIFLTIQLDFRYITLLSSIENLVFIVKFQSSFLKPIFLTIQPDFRCIILLSSIENLIFDVKFNKNGVFHYTKGFSIHNTIFFYRKPRFQCKISVFPYKAGRCFLTIQPDFRYIFSSRTSCFRYKISLFPCKNGVFYYTKGFSIHSTIFFSRKPRFTVFPYKVGRCFLTIQPDFRYI